MRIRILSVGAGLAAVLALGGTAARAQGTINALALVTGVQNGGYYNYTITLENLSSSTDPIQTMWFAWFPGADLLPSQPISASGPNNNWTDSIQGGGYFFNGSSYSYDGYSIEFTTQNAGSGIAPGNSANFEFTSSDSPTALSGDSPDYPGYPIGITYVYANGAPGPGNEPNGDSSSFVAVIPMPEPSSVAMLGLGAAVLFAAQRKLASREARS